MSHTAIDVIRVLLEESDDEHLWWYVTALRGCDIRGGDYELQSDIKSIFTCPLRGNVTTAWGIDEYDPDCNTSQILNEISESKYLHYIRHIESGYHALDEYYCILANATDDIDKRMYYHMCSDRCKRIHKELSHIPIHDSRLFEMLDDFVKLLRGDQHE